MRIWTRVEPKLEFLCVFIIKMQYEWVLIAVENHCAVSGEQIFFGKRLTVHKD